MPNDEDEEDDGKDDLPRTPEGKIDWDKIEEEYRKTFPARVIPPEEQAIIGELWRRKCLETDFAAYERGEPMPRAIAYCTTTAELKLSKWNGRHPPEKNMTETVVPSGSTLKIVMVSRMGDYGLTDDLSAEHGYQVRIPWDDARIINLRWEP